MAQNFLRWIFLRLVPGMLGSPYTSHRLHLFRLLSSSSFRARRPFVFIPRTARYTHPLDVQPFPAVTFHTGTLASADSCYLSLTSRSELLLKPDNRSPQGRILTFPARLSRLLLQALDCIGLGCHWPTRPIWIASYALRVPQTAGLLPASSGPHLAVTPLPSAKGWCNPPSASIRVFHPLANAHAGRAKEDHNQMVVVFKYARGLMKRDTCGKLMKTLHLRETLNQPCIIVSS